MDRIKYETETEPPTHPPSPFLFFSLLLLLPEYSLKFYTQRLFFREIRSRRINLSDNAGIKIFTRQHTSSSRIFILYKYIYIYSSSTARLPFSQEGREGKGGINTPAQESTRPRRVFIPLSFLIFFESR